MTPLPEVQPLAWDSEWLGFPVARLVAGPQLSADEVHTTIGQAQAAGVRLLYLVAAPNNLPLATAALANGAWLADCKVTYQLSLQHIQLPVVSTGFAPTLATTLTPALRQLALQSGEYSRFRRDVRMGENRFEELYTNWLGQILKHGLVWSITLPNDHLAVGMLAFTAHAGAASIELLAVAPAARRHGLGLQLVQAAQQAARQHDCTDLRVVTQEINRPACLFYERCGFQRVQAEHIYHLWL